MAFITYVLVTGLHKGMLSAFHPDVLVASSSSALASTAFEVFLLRMALYTFASDAACGVVRKEGAARFRSAARAPPPRAHAAPLQTPAAHVFFPSSTSRR